MTSKQTRLPNSTSPSSFDETFPYAPLTKNYFKSRFKFLKSVIPEETFNTICYYMTFRSGGIRRKHYHNKLKISLEDLHSILAFWQLQLYDKGDYLRDSVIQEIDDYLMAFMPLRTPTFISTKEDVYAKYHELPQKLYKDLPLEATESVNRFLKQPKKYVPKSWRLLDAIQELSEGKIPTTTVIWIVRLELTKKVYPIIAIEMNIQLSLSDIPILNKAIEQFFIANSTNHLQRKQY